MALVNRTLQYENNFTKPKSARECLDNFLQAKEVEQKHYALEQLQKQEGADLVLLSILIDGEVDPKHTSFVASLLAKKQLEASVIEGLFSLLEFENAHIRNLCIEILQNQESHLEEVLEKHLYHTDTDVRIFIANILGNSRLKNAREYLLKLLEKERDINVCMTCVDYLAEIGEIEDIALLVAVQDRFANDFYTQFAIKKAIRGIEANGV